MNYLPRRYGVRYGRRRAAPLRWLLAAALVGAFLVAFTHARNPVTTPANFIIAATATANEPEAVLPADILQTLRSAGLGSAPATAYVVDPGASQPDTIPLTPYLANGQVESR